ncbi:sporulation phosphorelay system protein KapB [Paenibacillus ginsengarvi]|uniref:Kinase n=1 Tax=Paenibacillus ginsengarvi TaxID=400777 RepID=A0A3B0CFF5_9BACL|nr:sporulation phosphorelay system protein KapB [Paenibacillus ginsengarvi]RKN84162.1 kinase [Paenibacillus ginsengarvi]
MNVNDYVTVEYKTGAYIAKVVETAPPRALVEITAVLKHPQQGDLHHPFQADVPLFHERRAAASREKVWVLSSTVKAYNGSVPAYDESLRAAWEEMVRSLERLAQPDQGQEKNDGGSDLALWAERALLNMRQLQKDYWR